jgi:hypothetical protein
LKNRPTGSVRAGGQDFEPEAQVEGTLTGEVGLRCQLTHRPGRRLDDVEAAGERAGGLGFTAALRPGNPHVTRCGEILLMMRRLVATFAALSLLASTVGAAAAVRGGPPPFPTFPGVWSHAEVNVKIRNSPHTLILDRGQVVQLSRQQVTLREADGQTVAVALAPRTIYQVNGKKTGFGKLRFGMVAETMRIDEGAAVRVRASARP